MKRARMAVLVAVLAAPSALLFSLATPSHAASFDCTKARSKLNRMICSDAELSALDSRVWDTFGVHLTTLAPAALAHVRERHLIWRRQRGLFDNTVSTISEDYRRHLAWLTHPLLALEGRYESDAGDAVRIEVDTSAPDRLAVQGETAAPNPFAWVAPAEGEVENRVVRDAESAVARPALTLREGMARLTPAFLGAPLGPVNQCRLALRFAPDFSSDTLTLESEGACGAGLAGVYRRPAPAVQPDPPWRAKRKTVTN